MTILFVAAHQIGESLAAGFNGMRWVVHGYTLALAALLLGAGSIADRAGHRRVFAIGLVSFMLTSIVCAAAPSSGFLIAARVAQGAAAALLFATSLALIANAFEYQRRSLAFGIWAGTVSAAAALGPVLGGLVLELGSWRLIFLLNIPAGLIALGILRARGGFAPLGTDRPIDWPGQLLSAAGLFILAFGITEVGVDGWTAPLAVGSFSVALPLLAAFAAVETRTRHPMLDLGLLRDRRVLGAAVGGFALHFAMFALLVFLILYLQVVLDHSALAAGLITLPAPAAGAVVGPISGRIGACVPVGARIAVGLGLICVGLLTMTGLGASSHWTDLLAGLLIAGVGVGITNPAIAEASLAGAQAERSGSAAAVNLTVRQLGTALGIAGLGSLLQLSARGKVDSALGDVPAPVRGEVLDAANEAAVGGIGEALRLAPQGFAADVLSAGKSAFAGAVGEIVLVAAVVAIVGGIGSLALINACRGRADTALLPRRIESSAQRVADEDI